jgi:hypothetical protein
MRVMTVAAVLFIGLGCGTDPSLEVAAEGSTEQAISNAHSCPNLQGDWWCVIEQGAEAGLIWGTITTQKVEDGYVLYRYGLRTNAYKKYGFPKEATFSFAHTDGAWHDIGFVSGRETGTCADGIYYAEAVWDEPCCTFFCDDSCGYNNHTISRDWRVNDTWYTAYDDIDPAGNIMSTTVSRCVQSLDKL